MTSARAAAGFLRKRLGQRKPGVAIVLGSSLGKVAELLEHPLAIPFAKVPGFPRPGVTGHAGTLIAGRIGAAEVLMVGGRVHYYEHGRADAMRPVIETIAQLGIGTLLLLNAAGSLSSDAPPGRLMLITDHINFSGANPLIGEKGDERFVSLTDAYDPSLCNAIRRAAKAEALPLAEGTYMWFSGPSFETPAEIRAARILGADAVGMSTVPEIILARRFGLKVAAISVITNFAAGIRDIAPSHAETMKQAGRAASDVQRLVVSLLEKPLHG
jgi:purine-nucleoside phosphorylase